MGWHNFLQNYYQLIYVISSLRKRGDMPLVRCLCLLKRILSTVHYFGSLTIQSCNFNVIAFVAYKQSMQNNGKMTKLNSNI